MLIFHDFPYISQTKTKKRNKQNTTFHSNFQLQFPHNCEPIFRKSSMLHVRSLEAFVERFQEEMKTFFFWGFFFAQGFTRNVCVQIRVPSEIDLQSYFFAIRNVAKNAAKTAFLCALMFAIYNRNEVKMREEKINNNNNNSK